MREEAVPGEDTAGGSGEEGEDAQAKDPIPSSRRPRRLPISHSVLSPAAAGSEDEEALAAIRQRPASAEEDALAAIRQRPIAARVAAGPHGNLPLLHRGWQRCVPGSCSGRRGPQPRSLLLLPMATSPPPLAALHSWRRAREDEGRRRSPMHARCAVPFSAQICALRLDGWQVGMDGKLGWQTVGGSSSLFCQNFMDEELR